jgi:hypothetical protein
MVTILIQFKFKVIPKKHDFEFFSKTGSISKPSNQKFAKSVLPVISYMFQTKISNLTSDLYKKLKE